jgi:hypothetical protein
MANRFPVTATDEAKPTPREDELTREQLAKQPESPGQQMQRTRRYFRLMKRGRAQHFARGLEWHLEAD